MKHEKEKLKKDDTPSISTQETPVPPIDLEEDSTKPKPRP